KNNLQTSLFEEGSSSSLSVEQRLLELNRQSAAARSRLLELIEQQKQSISVRVSPSVSPILPPAISANTEGTLGKRSFLSHSLYRVKKAFYFQLEYRAQRRRCCYLKESLGRIDGEWLS
ncbi:hypothetical protein XENOCAPTIV_027032, partial [Xenoophorus captivus]